MLMDFICEDSTSSTMKFYKSKFGIEKKELLPFAHPSFNRESNPLYND